MEALAVSICSEPGKYLALSKETILGMEALEPSEGASCPNGPGGSTLLVRSYHTKTPLALWWTQKEGARCKLLKNVLWEENQGGTHSSFMESVPQQESTHDSGPESVEINALLHCYFSGVP